MRKIKEISSDIIKLCDEMIDDESHGPITVFEQSVCGVMHSIAVMLRNRVRHLKMYRANMGLGLSNEANIETTIKCWKDLAYKLLYRVKKLKERDKNEEN